MSNKKTIFQEQLEALGFEKSKRPTVDPKDLLVVNSKKLNAEENNHKNKKTKRAITKPAHKNKKQFNNRPKRQLELPKPLPPYTIASGRRSDLTPENKLKLNDDLRKIQLKDSDSVEVRIKNGAFTIRKVGNAKEKALPARPIKPLDNHSSLVSTVQYISLAANSALNPDLLTHTKGKNLSHDFSASYRTQRFDDIGNETELVVGIDFGTTNTKVVVQETGTKTAWAIPFTNDRKNPYLLPTCIYFNGQHYKLSGENKHKISNLKLPLIMGVLTTDQLIKITAFIALVIRHCREWFLLNAADSFYKFTFEWFYHIGLPAANIDNKALVEAYRKAFLAAVIISIDRHCEITRDNVITQLNTIEKLGFSNNPLNNYLKICPEIQAQLNGYIQSDKWDRNKIKFMLVDVGGGTVDASILNITQDSHSNSQFNRLQSQVASLGVLILHQQRLQWIKESAIKSSFDHSILLSDISTAELEQDDLPRYPASVEDYVTNAKWPADYSIDKAFYAKFNDLIIRLINEVKLHIDDERTQWNHLQFLFCGGGSLHPLYNAILKWEKLDVISMSKPSKLTAPALINEDFHRISVAYGLSFNDLGEFENVLPLPDKTNQPTASYRDNYIDQP